MKVTVHRRSEAVAITTEFIKLESAMKLAGIAETGGMAKEAIQGGEVTVNGEVCNMRGKKLRPDDSFAYQGRSYVIHAAE